MPSTDEVLEKKLYRDSTLSISLLNSKCLKSFIILCLSSCINVALYVDLHPNLCKNVLKYIPCYNILISYEVQKLTLTKQLFLATGDILIFSKLNYTKSISIDTKSMNYNKPLTNLCVHDRRMTRIFHDLKLGR